MSVDTASVQGYPAEVLDEAQTIVKGLNPYEAAEVLDMITALGTKVPSPEETDTDPNRALSIVLASDPNVVLTATLAVLIRKGYVDEVIAALFG